MNVIVDTCVWSEALRKHGRLGNPEVIKLSELIEQGQAVMIGLIRQEILSGICEKEKFTKLRQALRAFPDVLISSRDYEFAAELSNSLRKKGIQSSLSDCLIAAVAHKRAMPLLTVDNDFKQIAKVVKLNLY